MTKQVIFDTVKGFKYNISCRLCKEKFTAHKGNKKYCDRCRKRLNIVYNVCKRCGDFHYSQTTDYCKKCRDEKGIKQSRSKSIKRLLQEEGENGRL